MYCCNIYVNTCKNTLAIQHSQYDDLLNIYRVNFKYGILTNGQKIDDCLLFWNAEQQIVHLNDILKDRERIFVCRISEFYCEDCVVYATVKLLQKTDSVFKQNVVFFGRYENLKNIKLFKEQYAPENIEVYHIDAKSLKIKTLCLCV